MSKKTDLQHDLHQLDQIIKQLPTTISIKINTVMAKDTIHIRIDEEMKLVMNDMDIPGLPEAMDEFIQNIISLAKQKHLAVEKQLINHVIN